MAVHNTASQGSVARPQGADLVVRHGRVFTAGRFIDDGAVVITKGRIAYVGRDSSVPVEITIPGSGRLVRTTDLPVLDARDCVVSSGFIDMHMHGGGGADVMDATLEAIQTMAIAHGRHGTTSFIAGAVTGPQDSLEAAAVAVRQGMDASLTPTWGGAQVIGFHLEGPYLCPAKKGAQNGAYMRPPSVDEMRRVNQVLGGGLRLVTLAPEIAGAMEAIRWLRYQGITVSMGHTAADYETALEAILAGVDHATHTFNAMSSLHHREPGILAAVLGENAVTAELIADTIHVHPGAMRVLWKAKGTERTCLVTDAGSAMDMPDGRYMLGDLAVEVKDRVCRLVEGGALASSCLSLDRGVKNMVERVGVPLEEALLMATSVPARQAGVSASKGSLTIGKDGDLCLLGPDLLCRTTVVGGWPLGRS